MSKTLSIGLAGYSFIIEEHAYIKLSDYLSALRNSLDSTEADEVMHDIEIRIVEILKDSLAKREVVNDADVERVIAQIGTPEAIEEQEEAYFSEKNTKNKSERTSYEKGAARQLFRDPSSQKIAGVCAGLAHYTGLDVTLMRVIWLAIFIFGIFSAGISSSLIALLYIILWIVLPKAETASDFLKMKGQPVNFDTLKNQSNKIVEFANESSQRVGEIYIENKPYINKAGSGIWNLIRYVLGGLFALMGISMLIGSFTLFGFIGNMGEIDFMGNVGFYLKDQNMEYVIVAFMFLSTFIPALLFSFIAIKLLSPQTKLKYTGYVFGGLVLVWLVLVGIVAATAVRQGTMYNGHNEESDNIAITAPNDTLYVDVKKVTIPNTFKSYWNDIYSDGKTIYKRDYPDVDITRKDVKAPYLIVKKDADGYNQALRMQIPVDIQGNRVLVPNYYTYPYEHRFRRYRVEYELVVPKNATIIKQSEYGIYINDNSTTDKNNNQNNQDNVDYDDEDESISIQSNGNTIVYNNNLKDSIIINGKKYPKEVGEKIIKDSINPGKSKNLKIEVKSGKEKVSINSNK